MIQPMQLGSDGMMREMNVSDLKRLTQQVAPNQPHASDSEEDLE